MEKPCVEGDAACQEAVWPVERWLELSMEELTDLGGSSGGRDEGGLLLPETPFDIKKKRKKIEVTISLTLVKVQHTMYSSIIQCLSILLQL